MPPSSPRRDAYLFVPRARAGLPADRQDAVETERAVAGADRLSTASVRQVGFKRDGHVQDEVRMLDLEERVGECRWGWCGRRGERVEGGQGERRERVLCPDRSSFSFHRLKKCLGDFLFYFLTAWDGGFPLFESHTESQFV